MSSEFLVIAPSDWILIDWEKITSLEPEMYAHSVKYFIESNQMHYIEEFLRKWEMFPVDKTITAAKLIEETFLIKVG